MPNITDYGFKCPVGGGTWYACATGSKFVGCCTADPCSTGCSQGNLRQGGFDITQYGKFAEPSCGLGSVAWSCTAGPSFWGCCKSNPCNATPPAICPSIDLAPAYLGLPDQLSFYAPSAAASASPTASPSASSTSSPSSAVPNKSSNAGAIGGGVAGGVLVILIGLAIFFFCRRRKQKQHLKNPEAATPMMATPVKGGYSGQDPGQSPPPTYSSPNPNVYQDTPVKGYNHPSAPYQQYGYQAHGVQELPAETSPPTTRYSELPAESLSSRHAFAAELESPEVTPRPLQTEFSTDMAKRVNEGAGAASGENRR